jgi:hypothetical protein
VSPVTGTGQYFARERAARLLAGWLREAAEDFGIEVVVVDLPARVRAAVQQALGRQRMVNPTDPS